MTLAVLGRRGLFDAVRLSTGTYDRSAFDGEVGWAVDQARRYAEGQSLIASERVRTMASSALIKWKCMSGF